MRPDDGRFVGHFEAVGHVAGERHVEHGRMHPAVLDHILDGRNQIARSPRESAAGFENQPQVRMPGPEIFQNGNQFVAVVPRGGHQMAAAHIEPLYPIEIRPEMRVSTASSASADVPGAIRRRRGNAALDARRKSAVRRQLFGRDAQPRTGNAGVVEVRFDGRILRIDAQAARKAADKGPLPEALELRDGVEGDMVAATEYLVDIAVGISRGVGVGAGLPYSSNTSLASAAELAVAPSEWRASSGKTLHMAQAFRATIISAPDSRRTRSIVPRFASSSFSSRT